MEKINPLEISSHYNKNLLEGIKHFKAQNFNEAINSFKTASIGYPNKLEPYFYMAITILKNAKNTSEYEHLVNVFSYLDKAFSYNPNNAPLLYMRSIVRFASKNLNEALIEIDQAIEKSEDNIPKYYYLRGMIYANGKSYKNALEDFSIVVQLDPKHSKAYLNRAKCYFLLGVKDKAFFDLKKFSELKMSSSELHIWVGHFLINDGSYALATQAYTNSMNIKYKENILIFRAKSNIMARELNAALEDLEQILEISKTNKAKYDITALMALKMSSTQRENKPIENNDLNKALEQFTLLINSKKQGLIFKLNDIYFYKGLMHFYLGQYTYALDDFEKALDIKKVFCEYYKESVSSKDSLNELLEEFENEEFPEKIEEKQNQEMTTFTNNSFNIYEFYHNCMIVAIKLKNWKMSHEYCKKLMDIIPLNFKTSLTILMKCINIEKNLKENNKFSEEGYCDFY